MPRDTAAARKVGALLLAAVAVAALALFAIGDRQNLFSTKRNYFIRWNTVAGLRSGAQVTLDGVEVGHVEQVVLPEEVRQQELKVFISLDSRYAQRVRKDSIARIKTLGLLGDKYVEISSGSPDAVIVPEGGEIEAPPIANVDALRASGEDIVNSILKVTNSLASILARMESGEGILGELTKDVEPGKRITTEVLASLAEIRTLLEKIEDGNGPLSRLVNDKDLGDRLAGAIARLDAIGTKVENGDGLLPELLTDRKTKERFDRALDNLEQSTRELSGVAKNLREGEALIPRLLSDPAYGREITDELKALVKNLNEVGEKLNHGDGSAAKIVNDPELYQAMKDIVVGVNDSKLLRWLIRNRQKAGIQKRYGDTKKDLERSGTAPEPPR